VNSLERVPQLGSVVDANRCEDKHYGSASAKERKRSEKAAKSGSFELTVGEILGANLQLDRRSSAARYESVNRFDQPHRHGPPSGRL
jgi:hypothetical protein